MPSPRSIQENKAERKLRKYVSNVHRGLDDALERARASQQENRWLADPDHCRLVVFSDLHRGTRTRADDFKRCERAYNSALAYYYELGYTLLVLGDAEELWKERPGSVIESYQRSLKLESRFHNEGRYLRVWGNHDDEWSDHKAVKEHLAPIFEEQGPELLVHEGLILEFRQDGGPLGEIFFVHGHQGTGASDRYSKVARWPVRHIYRPFQRDLTPVTRPSRV